MKKSKKIMLLSTLVLTILLFLTSCKEEGKEPQYPLGGTIPQSDIVFMPDVDSDADASSPDSKTLGFVDTNGNNHQEYTFLLFGGAPSMFGVPIPSGASHPRWSINGDELVFSISNTAPNMRLVDEDGKMYGQNCKDIGGYLLTFGLDGSVLTEISKHDQVYEAYKDMAHTTLIARYNLKACQIVSVFSLPLPFGSFVSEINESHNGLLTTSFHDWDEDIDKILIFDTVTGESQTLPGYHPSLTEDGTLLAYYNREGALAIRDMETEEEWELISVFPNLVGPGPGPSLMSMPGWSPDNEWLVYNTPEGEIFKINIKTGENVYLTYGWAPDWR